MILLIFNDILDTTSINSIIKLLINLNRIRNDIIVYKDFFVNNPEKIENYKNNILEIIKNNDIKLIFCVWSYISNNEIKSNNSIPQTFNIINHLENMNLDKNIKILCHTHDFFYTLQQYSKLEKTNYYIEIGFKDQIKILTSEKNKIYSVLNCANNNFNLELNKNPINKILLSGGIHPSIYPERHHFYNYAKNNSLKIDIKKHPGYFTKDEKYPEILNNYIACYYSSINPRNNNIVFTNYKVVLAKCFEICAVGSLLLSDIKSKLSLSRLGFVENVNCMFISEENYDKVIDYILNPDNKDKIDEIRKNGQLLVKKYHMEQNRIDQINQILDDIINQ